MSKELLTEVLEGMHSLYEYISIDLASERLTIDNEQKRHDFMPHLKELMTKIQATHPSIRPRLNTPAWRKAGASKKPAPPPPAITTTTPPEDIREEGEEPLEDYVDVEQQGETLETAEDYLAFSPTQDELQEVYEEMSATDQQQDVYEEPELPGGPEPMADAPEDLYEEPVPTSLDTPTSTHSQENSGSGLFERGFNQSSQSSMTMSSMMAEDWNAVYSTSRPKGEKCRVKDLKKIIIKGYLEKLGGKSHKTWQKRYCVISGPLMYFYEKDSSKSYNNSIALPLFAPTESSDFTVPKKKQYSFKLTHTDMATGKKKDYFFRANSEDVRNKWVTAIRAICDTATNTGNSSATLPRMPSNKPVRVSPPTRRRTASVGKIEEEQFPEEDAQQELYEEMAGPGEESGGGGGGGAVKEDDQEEYVDVVPSPSGQIPELNSSDESGVDEYIDVDPQPQEDPTNLSIPPRQPPPPTTPPPPSFNQPLPPVTAAPPSHRHDPQVDVEKVYIQDGNGVEFDKVFVALWDFPAGDRDELNLKRGDLVFVREPSSTAEWWFGEALDATAEIKLGRSGFFPQSYSSSAFQSVS